MAVIARLIKSIIKLIKNIGRLIPKNCEKPDRRIFNGNDGNGDRQEV
jgi:hypothetical protein